MTATLVAISAMGLVAAAQGPSEVDVLVERVGARIADYYRRAQSVICLEQSTVQPIQWNWSPDGMSRTVESELRVESEAADGDSLPDAKVIREIIRINGRAPRDRDKTDRSGCGDPHPLSPEPLAFLLPAGRGEYRFTSVHAGREKDRAALIVDFESANRKSAPVLVEDEAGHKDCFGVEGPVAARGRVWVDPSTNEVLRVEQHIDGPVDVRVSLSLQRRYGLADRVVLDRADTTLHYKMVRFTDPDEAILLPEAIESMTVFRSGLQSTRRTQTFRDYRRFLTGGRIVRDP